MYDFEIGGKLIDLIVPSKAKRIVVGNVIISYTKISKTKNDRKVAFVLCSSIGLKVK